MSLGNDLLGPELFMGWVVNLRVGLGWIGLSRDFLILVGWVGLWAQNLKKKLLTY